MSRTYGCDARAWCTLIRKVVMMGVLGFVYLYLSDLLMACTTLSLYDDDDDDDDDDDHHDHDDHDDDHDDGDDDDDDDDHDDEEEEEEDLNFWHKSLNYGEESK
uniref:Uncharacterized protein n=1 Tax=Octopus bimaculoides TaxID=37653 RepID=A0A0L8IEC1_OCTBM